MEYPRLLSSSCIAAALAWHVASAGAVEACTQTSAPIATDRPDVTNSSVVVPVGSLQNENGANVSRHSGADVFDGTNSRWRLGILPCFEVLIDLPNYVGTFRGAGDSGFGNVAPAFKWQISPAPGKVDLSMTVGAGLPTVMERSTLPGAGLICHLNAGATLPKPESPAPRNVPT